MKFECQETCGGACCRVPKGKQMFIFLTKEDRFRIAAHLKKPINKFAKMSHFTYTRFGGSGWQWHLKMAQGANHCRFLVDGRCSIQAVKPVQCRTWPFWKEHFKDGVMKEDVETAIKQECPGIGKGEELPQAEIESMISEQRQADAKYSNQGR